MSFDIPSVSTMDERKDVMGHDAASVCSVTMRHLLAICGSEMERLSRLRFGVADGDGSDGGDESRAAVEGAVGRLEIGGLGGVAVLFEQEEPAT